MRIFDHMNTNGNSVCPICKTKEDKPVILAEIDGTQDGNISEAIQVHVDCLELRYAKVPDTVIYHVVRDDSGESTGSVQKTEKSSVESLKPRKKGGLE